MAITLAGSSRDMPIVVDDGDDDVILLNQQPSRSKQHRGPVRNEDARTFHELPQAPIPPLRDGDPGYRLLRRMENALNVGTGGVQTQSTSVTMPSSSNLKRKREDPPSHPDDSRQQRKPSHSTVADPETPEPPAPVFTTAASSQPKLSKKARKQKRKAVEISSSTSQSTPLIPLDATTLTHNPMCLPLPQQILGWDAQHLINVPGAMYALDPITPSHQHTPITVSNPLPIPSQYNPGLLPFIPSIPLHLPPIFPSPPSLENVVLSGTSVKSVKGVSKPRKSIGVEPEIPTQGIYPLPRKMRPQDPRTSLVLDYLPRKLRKMEFLLNWCKSCGCDAPVHAFTNNGSSKAFIQFATIEDAVKAFNSPRLPGSDGRTGIRAWWYRYGPEVSQDDAEDGEILNPSRTNATEQQQTSNTQPALRSSITTPTSRVANDLEKDEDDHGNCPLPIHPSEQVAEMLEDRRDEMDVSCDEVVPASNSREGRHNITENAVVIATASTSFVSTKTHIGPDLEELRKRVQASKETNRLKNACLPPKPNNPQSSSAPTPDIVSSTTSTEPVVENLTPPSLTSGSSSFPADEAQDFVSAFITDAIRSASGPSIITPEAKALEPILDFSEETTKKQKRLEQHIAESKDLMEQYTAAASKAVREQLMKIIKAKNSLFDVENKASDRRIEQAKIQAARLRQRRQQLRNFRWPETTREANILILSDDEDDDYMSDG